jgi:hypothetical protein
MDDHLDLTAPAYAMCSQCRRYTWSASALGRLCCMPQPNGQPCAGRFVALHETPPTAPAPQTGCSGQTYRGEHGAAER